MKIDSSLRIGWSTPARQFVEGIPVGNGRTGAMWHGSGIATLDLTDATGWTGSPHRAGDELDNLLAAGVGPETLAELRAKLEAGRDDEALALIKRFQGSYSQSFLALAKLIVEVDGEATQRELNLDRALARDTVTGNAGPIDRELFASQPAGVVIFHHSSYEPFSASVRLATEHQVASMGTTENGIDLGVEFPIDGPPLHEATIPGHSYRAEGEPWDPFAAVAVRVATDGSVCAADGELRVSDASYATIIAATDTRARAWWQDPATASELSREEIASRAALLADAATKLPIDELRADHAADVAEHLGASQVRIGPLRAGRWDVDADVFAGDEQLRATVLHAWGRYLLFSSSRTGGPAANLQGIWNDSMRPAWSSNYTTNINTEMNYWLSGPANLTESVEPLVGLLERMATVGGRVARELYGCRGWVAHHNSDLWGWALPVGRGQADPSWSVWPMAGTWLVQNALDHLDFEPDSPLRPRIAAVTAGAVEFLLDWLVPQADGTLGTSPSTSPEAHFLDANGDSRALTTSTTMDIALAHALLTRAQGLVDPELAARAAAAAAKLPPMRGRADGVLAEWCEDYPDEDPHHRHLSPAVGLYPLALVEPGSALEDAHRAFLDERGPGAMGWSWAWKILLRARLGDAEAARSLFLEASRRYEKDPMVDGPVDGSEWGGLLPNLLSTHPPFQIDGNYGMTAALTEMLVQSHGDEVELLPALPAEWSEGSVIGLRVRGGRLVDFAWQDGRVTTVNNR